MDNIEKLKKEAIEACNFRGHDMGDWEDSITENWSYSRCRNCSKQVTVETNPAPNSIDISGEAVAIGCPETEKCECGNQLHICFLDKHQSRFYHFCTKCNWQSEEQEY